MLCTTLHLGFTPTTSQATGPTGRVWFKEKVFFYRRGARRCFPTASPTVEFGATVDPCNPQSPAVVSFERTSLDEPQPQVVHVDHGLLMLTPPPPPGLSFSPSSIPNPKPQTPPRNLRHLRHLRHLLRHPRPTPGDSPRPGRHDAAHHQRDAAADRGQ